MRLGERGLPTPGRTQGSKPVRSGKGPQGALKGIKQVTRRSAAAATTSRQRTRAPGVHFCRDARGRLALRECAPGRRGRPVLHRGPGSHRRPRALGTPVHTRLAARVLSRSQIPGTFSFGETMLRLFALGWPPGSGFLLTKQYGPKLWLYKTSQQFYFVVSGMDDFRSNNYLHQIDGFFFQPGDWRLL